MAPARRALDDLLVRHPESPLRERALVRAVELAIDAGDADGARRWLALGRSEPLPAATVAAVESLAWRLGRDTNDGALLASAARRLLVEAPLEASRLRVVDALAARREPAADWRLWLSPEELARRAEALLEVELPAGALTTLDAVPPQARGFDWQLLAARALTASGRGAEAYARLTALGAGPALGARLEWQRAEAAAAAAKRAAPAEAERFRRLAREHLLAVARGADEPGLRTSALRRLALDYFDAGRTAEAVAALRELSALDPRDATGARPLWEEGWRAYERGQLERAGAFWADLIAVYPTASVARSARYWRARALERRGRATEALPHYLELAAAKTVDFYARQAALRLAGAAATQPAAPPERAPWPADPRLARAEELAALALEPIARRELELVATGADPRAAAALEAVVLAAAGERRASLHALRRAFPELGGAHQERVPERALALFYPRDFEPVIARAAAAEGLPAALVFGIVHQESAFDPVAVSRSGARGLMQLLPSTGREVARRMGLPFSTARLAEPDYSLKLGTRYFRQLLGQFDGRVELALAGYNGGPGRIARLWRAAGPAPELDRFLEGLTVTESRNYVKRIVVLAETYRSLYPDLG